MTSNGVIVIVLSLLSPFIFPIPVTILAGFLASLASPFAALFTGILADLLYAAPGTGLPLGTLLGICGALTGFFVRTFVRARMTLPNV